jgi:hypothetical protein
MILSLLLVGCGAWSSQTFINPAPHPMAARPPASVEVFTAGAPTRPHVDVALLEVRQRDGWSFSTTAVMIAQLREDAAEMGCDGIVVTGPNNHTVDSGLGTGTLHGFFATCVAYTDLSPVAARAPAASGTPASPGSTPETTARR